MSFARLFPIVLSEAGVEYPNSLRMRSSIKLIEMQMHAAMKSGQLTYRG
jgi:hypothetical protein